MNQIDRQRLPDNGKPAQSDQRLQPHTPAVAIVADFALAGFGHLVFLSGSARLGPVRGCGL